ncbi:MAG: peptidylprolyl isomerase [Allomuricauda sp.]
MKFHRVIYRFYDPVDVPGHWDRRSKATSSTMSSTQIDARCQDAVHNQMSSGHQWKPVFITHGPTPWLDNKHTVFGHVEQGQEVVDAIAQGDVIESLGVRIGEEAKNWNAIEAFRKFEGA